MISTLLSLAAQFPPPGSDTVRIGARFFVLDGTPEDHPSTGVLARVAAVLPHGIEVGDWREVPQFLAEVAAEAPAAAGGKDRRSRAVPVHSRSAAVPRPAPPRGRFQLLEPRGGGRTLRPPRLDPS